MPSRTEVTTDSYLRPDSGAEIRTNTSTWSDGDSPLEKEIGGHTAGMVGQGNALAHSRYLSERDKPIIYRGS